MATDPLESRVESLENDVDQLSNTVEILEAAVGNVVTAEQLEQVKSDLRSELLWKMVMYGPGSPGPHRHYNRSSGRNRPWCLDVPGLAVPASGQVAYRYKANAPPTRGGVSSGLLH